MPWENKAYAESSGSPLKGAAKKLLQQRDGAVADGKPITSAIGRFRFEQARSVFERYNITSPSDLRDAARRLDAGAPASSVSASSPW